MQMISELKIEIKEGKIPLFTNEVYQYNCSIQSIKLLEKNSLDELFEVNIIYNTMDSIKSLIESLQKIGNEIKVISHKNILQDLILGGFIETKNKYILKNLNDYETGIAGAMELILDRINSKEAIRYTGIPKNIAVIGCVKTDNDSPLARDLSIQTSIEKDSAIINQFVNMNTFPFIISYDHPEDLIKTIKYVEKSFSAFRIRYIDDENIDLYKQFHSKMLIPISSRGYTDLPIYLLSILLKLLKKNKISPENATIGIMGINISAIRTTSLLNKIGCKRVLGYDHNEKNMLNFENSGGLATTAENIFSNSDIVILLKNNFSDDEFKNIIPGQLFISLLKESEIDQSTILSKGVRKFVQGSDLEFDALHPGIINGMIKSGIRNLSDNQMIHVSNKISTLINDDFTMPDIFSDIHTTISNIIEEIVK